MTAPLEPLAADAYRDLVRRALAEDVGRGDITTAAIAHLAHSTPEQFRFTATDFNSYVTVSIADGAPRRENGFMKASTGPGLGIEPKRDILGKPVLTFGGT